MGLISWVKHKYYQHIYDNAIALYDVAHYDNAIRALNKILDVHPSAPHSLLDALHKKLSLEGNRQTIEEIASLYKRYNEVGSVCNEYARLKLQQVNYKLCVDYSAIMHKAGLHQIKDVFVLSAEKLILNDAGISNLNILASESSLLEELSKQLRSTVQNWYSANNIKDALRVAELILPYLSDSRFVELYYNIQFDIFATEKIDDHKIFQYDKLSKEIDRKVSKSGIDKLKAKAILLCHNRLQRKQYLDALLLSSRLQGISSAMGAVYADSAYALYQSQRNYTKYIDNKLLYSILGEGLDFINALERFVPYSSHGEKYVNSVCEYLKSSNNIGVSDLLAVFKNSWRVKADLNYFESAIKSTTKGFCTVFVHEIVANPSKYINTEDRLRKFETSLCEIGNNNLVISTLEILLSKGINIRESYIKQVLITITGYSVEEKLELLNKAINLVSDTRLFAKKLEACREYVGRGSSTFDYIEEQAGLLIGKHEEAEVLLAELALERFNKTKNDGQRIINIKRAIEISTKHNKLFLQDAYDAKRSEITRLANEFAATLYKRGENDLAHDLLFHMRNYKFDWFETYGQYILSEISNVSAEEAFQILNSVLIKGSSENAGVLKDLWKSYINILQQRIEPISHESRVIAYNEAMSYIQLYCNQKNKSKLLSSLSDKLDDQYFEHGKDCEKDQDYLSAISCYKAINSYRKDSPEIICRELICLLKSNVTLSESDTKNINAILDTKLKSDYQKDLAYRWCLYLIRKGDYDTARVINARILDTDKQIEELCLNIEVKAQNLILEKVNIQIAKLNAGEIKAQDAIKLGKSLTKTVRGLNLKTNISTASLNKMNIAIRNYAICEYYKQGDYAICQDNLKVQDSTYLSDPLNLRNIAIMCLLAAEEGQLTRTNYKEFLAIWATAIYQPMLFVKSLDYTSWDDAYTFSLDNVLGVIHDGDSLPDNVNYSSEMNSSIVYIKDVQRALISRMEAALKDNHDYMLFFNSQIEAMHKFSEQQLDVACVIVAPYLLQLSSDYKKSVKNSLEIEEKGHYGNWEAILEIGNLYGLEGKVFSSYTDAQMKLEKALGVITNGGSTRTAFSESSINAIRSYDSLFASIVSAVITKLNEAISLDLGYIQIDKDFSQICKVINDDNLSFSFSNYINKSVVKELNDKSITLAKGAKILFDIFPYCGCNPHLKRNIENIIEALIHNYITDGDKDNVDVLDSFLLYRRDYDNNVVSALRRGDTEQERMLLNILFISHEDRINTLRNRLSNKSPKIKKALDNTLSEMASAKVNIELSSIVDDVNKKTLKKSDALEKVYNLYKANKDNTRVCENLTILIPLCIMEYIIPDATDSRKVQRILTLLINNQSSTFKSKNLNIRQARSTIWNQLPYNAKTSLQEVHALSSTGTTLGMPSHITKQGWCLILGLDYLRLLS